MKTLPIALLFILTVTTVQAGWFGPNNYEECVLKNMKGVNSDVAARIVRNACLEKFPSSEKVYSDVELGNFAREVDSGLPTQSHRRKETISKMTYDMRSRSLILHFTRSTAISPNEINARKEQLQVIACTDESSRPMIEDGVRFTYIYEKENGDLLFSFNVKDCIFK